MAPLAITIAVCISNFGAVTAAKRLPLALSLSGTFRRGCAPPATTAAVMNTDRLAYAVFDTSDAGLQPRVDSGPDSVGLDAYFGSCTTNTFDFLVNMAEDGDEDDGVDDDVLDDTDVRCCGSRDGAAGRSKGHINLSIANSSSRVCHRLIRPPYSEICCTIPRQCKSHADAASPTHHWSPVCSHWWSRATCSRSPVTRGESISAT